MSAFALHKQTSTRRNAMSGMCCREKNWLAACEQLRRCDLIGVDGPRSRHRRAIGEPSNTKRITIGLDLAKHVFQAHGVDVSGAVTLFVSLARARSALAAWMGDYNTIRPHSALCYRPPAPETILPSRPIWPALSTGSSQIGRDQCSPPH